MRQTIKLGSVGNIRVQVHWTLLVLLAGLFVWLLAKGGSVVLAARGLILVALLFGCVVLHELGHGLAARYLGVRTLDVTLYPIGGIARLEHMPRNPKQELMIACAGPVVNLAIALGLLILFLYNSTSVRPGHILDGSLLVSLVWMNLALFAFNLLPAFPMDGGRVLRALLATRLSYDAATRIAVWTGQTLAILFGLAAIFSVPGFRGFNPVLLFIAVFVFLAAQQEGRQVLHPPAD